MGEEKRSESLGGLSDILLDGWTSTDLRSSSSSEEEGNSSELEVAA